MPTVSSSVATRRGHGTGSHGSDTSCGKSGQVGHRGGCRDRDMVTAAGDSSLSIRSGDMKGREGRGDIVRPVTCPASLLPGLIRDLPTVCLQLYRLMFFCLSEGWTPHHHHHPRPCSGSQEMSPSSLHRGWAPAVAAPAPNTESWVVSSAPAPLTPRKHGKLIARLETFP